MTTTDLCHLNLHGRWIASSGRISGSHWETWTPLHLHLHIVQRGQGLTGAKTRTPQMEGSHGKLTTATVQYNSTTPCKPSTPTPQIHACSAMLGHFRSAHSKRHIGLPNPLELLLHTYDYKAVIVKRKCHAVCSVSTAEATLVPVPACTARLLNTFSNTFSVTHSLGHGPSPYCATVVTLQAAIWRHQPAWQFQPLPVKPSRMSGITTLLCPFVVIPLVPGCGMVSKQFVPALSPAPPQPLASAWQVYVCSLPHGSRPRISLFLCRCRAAVAAVAHRLLSRFSGVVKVLYGYG